MIELRFYHRQGCHLCDEMWEQLSAMDGLEKILLLKVDIDRDSEIKAEYGLRIPCLEGPDGVSLSEHYLDQSRLLSYLRDV